MTTPEAADRFLYPTHKDTDQTEQCLSSLARVACMSVQVATKSAKKQRTKTAAYASKQAKKISTAVKAAAKKIGLIGKLAEKGKKVAKLAKKLGKQNAQKALKIWGRIKSRLHKKKRAAKKKIKKAATKTAKKMGLLGSNFKKFWKVPHDCGCCGCVWWTGGRRRRLVAAGDRWRVPHSRW